MRNHGVSVWRLPSRSSQLLESCVQVHAQLDCISADPSGMMDAKEERMLWLSQATNTLRPPRLVLLVSLLIGFSIATSGCARYQFGNRSLYNPDIRTVYIPQVRNDTFRHKLGPRLTEALVRAIELRTPYKVVASPSADSTLTCRITTEFKRTVTEAITDEPRAIERMLSIQLTWIDRQGNQLMTRNFIPDGELAFYFIQGTEFVPEGGQSIATAEQRVIERLADEIVGQMETRW